MGRTGKDWRKPADSTLKRERCAEDLTEPEMAKHPRKGVRDYGGKDPDLHG